MTAEPHPTPPRDSDSDPDPGAAAPRRLSEAEVQSLQAIIHDVKGPGAADTNHWELETMAPLNAASTVSFPSFVCPAGEFSGGVTVGTSATKGG